MNELHIKKGWTPKIEGAPSLELDDSPNPLNVALIPETIPYIKPKLRVKEGDHVQIGSVLFIDKRNPEIQFLSPGCGSIDKIVFGNRRVIQAIIIKLDQKETFQSFQTITENELDALDRDTLIRMLISGGVWPYIRALPFRDIASPTAKPPSIIVNLLTREPFQPNPEVYLKGNKDMFMFGMHVLQKISNNKVMVYTSPDNPFVTKVFSDVITHKISGPYPLDDPGVFLYHVKQSSDDNRSWFINGQDVIFIAKLLLEGKYPIERIVSVAGTGSRFKKHIRTRLGVPLSHICKHAALLQDIRTIVGGVFTGYKTSLDSYLGFYDTSVMLVPEGNEPELFGFLRLGYSKPTHSRTFFSVFNRSPKEIDCNLHGCQRACVNCGFCVSICAVDILPQFLMKSILAGDTQEALMHGLLDCAECGLCTYVCPSKISLHQIIQTAKRNYYLET